MLEEYGSEPAVLANVVQDVDERGTSEEGTRDRRTAVTKRLKFYPDLL